MKKTLSLILILCTALLPLLAQPANLLRNPTFEGEIPEGKFVPNWYHSPTGSFRRIEAPEGITAKYALEIKNDDEKANAHIIQSGLKLVSAQDYIFTVDFKGDKGTVFQAYSECSNPWKTNLREYKCTGQWQKASVPLFYKEANALPYAVFRIKGKGKAIVANPSIVVDNTRLSNGSFELGAARWQLDHGNVVAIEKPHGNILELKNLEGKASASQKGIHLKGGQLYKLTYQASGGTDKKYTDVQGATWFRVTPQLNGAPLPGTETWKDSFPNWQTKWLTFILEKDADIDIVCELKNPGSVRFDNITLAPTLSDIPLLDIELDPPFSYGNAIYLPDHEALENLSGILVSDLKIAKYLIEFNGQVYEIIPTEKEQPFNALELPKKPGTYPLKAQALDDQGKKLADASLDFTVYGPTSKRKVTFRDDHVMLIDGKPFFPLFTWGVRGELEFAERYKRIANCGFNAAMCTDKQIDDLARLGILGIPSVPASLPEFDSRDKAIIWFKQFKKRFDKTANNPNTIAYFIIDEPSWNGRPYQPIQDAYALIRKLDPFHPIFLNEAPRGNVEDLRQYAAAADAYGVDIYPIPSPNSHSDLEDKTMTSVGKYTDICADVLRYRRPVWMTLQAFSWGAIRERNDEKFIYPTVAESRFMAYDAIVHGATGLAYWGFNWKLENWDFINELGITIRELASASGVLTARTVYPAAITADKPQIAILHKYLDKQDTFIVINESPEPATVTFKAADTLPGKLFVLVENRSIATTDNSFKDTFKPYDVHIYSTVPSFPPPCSNFVVPPAKDTRVAPTNDFRLANWIWFPNANKTANHQTYFIRDFELTDDIAKVEIHITADDLFQAFVNGKLALEHSQMNGLSHNTVSVLDITKSLKQGKNRLAIHAADGGQPPCGLLFALRLVHRDGKVTHILSDDKVLTSETKDANWLKPDFAPANWQPAQIINKYGEGPWGGNAAEEPAELDSLGLLPFP